MCVCIFMRSHLCLPPVCSICDVTIIQRGSGKAFDGVAFMFQNRKKSLRWCLSTSVCLSVLTVMKVCICDLDIFMLFQNHDNKTSLESSEFRFLLLKRLPGSRPSESESGGLKCYILASHLAKEAFWVLTIPRHQIRALCRCQVPNTYMKVCTYGWKR